LIADAFINGMPGGHNSKIDLEDLIEPSVIEKPAWNIRVLSKPPILKIASLISVGHVEIIFSSFGSMKAVEVTSVLRNAITKICF
jgi:hypothetical protein